MTPGEWLASGDAEDRTPLSELERALLPAFPAALASDVRIVTQALPPGRLRPSIWSDGPVRVQGERLTLPYRLYNPEPAEGISAQLTPTQVQILHCLYSRHHNGYVRQHHLNRIIGATEPWIVPFVIKLVGEYVIDIVLDIQRGLTDVVTVETARNEAYGQFVGANREFMFLTGQRVASYWRRYYANRYPRRYYPGRIVLDELHEAAARHSADSRGTSSGVIHWEEPSFDQRSHGA